MNNGTHRNGNGNGTATAVRRNGNGSRPNGARPTIPVSPHGAGVEHKPAPTAPEALHWDALAPVVSEALAQPLEPALVSQRKGRGGRKFDYIEGHTAIDQANRIFGFGGWGYELIGDVTLRQIESTDSRTGEVTSSTAYSAMVRVTVPGAPSRTDVGFQAVTDALKRALRSFGDRFGNGLYGDPPNAERGSRDPDQGSRTQRSAASGRSGTERRSQPPPRRRVEAQPAAAESNDQADARNLRAHLIELSAQQGFSEAQVRVAVEGQDWSPAGRTQSGRDQSADRLRRREARTAAEVRTGLSDPTQSTNWSGATRSVGADPGAPLPPTGTEKGIHHDPQQSNL